MKAMIIPGNNNTDISTNWYLYVKKEFRHINDKLNTEYHEYKNRGHFEEKEFPELVFCVKQKLNKYILE